MFQERLYNPEKRSGLLFQKFEYEQRKRNKLKYIIDGDPDDGMSVSELTDFFAKCVLPDDKTNLVKTLHETTVMRKRHLFRSENVIFKSSLNLFLVCPELVKSLDFSIC